MASSSRTWMGGFKRSFLGLIGVLLLFSAFASAASDPSQSPSADAELICHTENPDECYPKVFVPTNDFQVVHEDQDLPPGLHVQLDIQTGQKQAKLYDPTETNPELEGLPVDRSMLVVDSPENDDDEIPIPAGAPLWEAFGKIKEPREKLEGFGKMTAAVKRWVSGTPSDDSDVYLELIQSLERLEDVAHDMYHGLQLAEDPDAVRALLCMALQQDTSELVKPLTERAGFLAASALASAVRNNPPALKAIEAVWDTHIANSRCLVWIPQPGQEEPARREPVPLEQALFDGAAPQCPTSDSDSCDDSTKTVPEHTRYPLMILEGFLRSPVIRGDFLNSGGTGNMLKTLQSHQDSGKPLKQRVARILNDIFLDEENGAVLGLWPTEAPPKDKKAEAELCEGPVGKTKEQCWEYVLAQIGQEHPDERDWSEPLLKMVQNRRPTNTGSNSGGRIRDEL